MERLLAARAVVGCAAAPLWQVWLTLPHPQTVRSPLNGAAKQAGVLSVGNSAGSETRAEHGAEWEFMADKNVCPTLGSAAPPAGTFSGGG